MTSVSILRQNCEMSEPSVMCAWILSLGTTVSSIASKMEVFLAFFARFAGLGLAGSEVKINI